MINGKGELLLHDDWPNKKFIKPDEVENYDEYEVFNYESWGEEYEQDVTEYKSPSGDDIVIRAYYGYE